MRYFCCCCHLRTGSIVLAWLQIMGSLSLITGFVASLDYILVYVNTFYNRSMLRYYEILQPIFKLLIIDLIVKCFTCFTLIWGIVYRNHYFMQPWLFLQCFENVIMSISGISAIFTAIVEPRALIGLPSFVLSVLGWYFWFCVREVYKQDYKTSTVYWQEYNYPLSIKERVLSPDYHRSLDVQRPYPRNM